jgi:alpha-1,3/alpha-1,6-mannosyltransferase
VDNITTLSNLVEKAQDLSLSYDVFAPSSSSAQVPSFSKTEKRSEDPDVLFLLNFTTSQRSALLNSPSTRVLLYTPANEHFGIGPVEGMLCGLPVLACDSGGPTESIIDSSPSERRTGWLRPPSPEVWADALTDILHMSESEREQLSVRARARAKEMFGMDAMAHGLEAALIDATSMGPVRVDEHWFMALAVVILGAMLVAFTLPSVLSGLTSRVIDIPS